MSTEPDALTSRRISKAVFLARKFDAFDEIIGKVVAYLIVPLIFILSYEVIVRYGFDSPTLWAWDVNMYLGGLMMLLGGGYAHLHKSHVLVEVFLEKMSVKQRALLDMFISPIIIISLSVLVWFGWDAAWQSFKMNEKYSSLWEPPIYYLRLSIPVGGFLFILQEISNFIKTLNTFLQPVREKEGR